MNRFLPLSRLSRVLPLFLLALPTCAVDKASTVEKTPAAVQAPSALETLRKGAQALEPLISVPWVKQLLQATAQLPQVQTRTFLVDKERRRAFTVEQAEALPAEVRATLETREVNEERYYMYPGEPLAYARPLELLGEVGFIPEGSRVLDFGYGNIGHLEMLAMLGADARGIEINPVLPLLYASKQGRVRGLHGTDGAVHTFHGFFPKDAALREAVGGGYDLFLSKNTLKNGYIHPEQPIPNRIDLGVSDEEFLRTLHAMLKPGGRVMIYNLCPPQAPPGQPYIPWADGRSPFPRAQWEGAGFRVIAFDMDDTEAARRMAHALGWDAGPTPMMKLEELFALYTLVEKPAQAALVQE